jgi:hypothetical protein
MGAIFERSAIDRFAAGGERLARSIAGLSRDDFLARPIPNTWSIQEIVVHMMDSDLVGCDRMKRLAAMERPLLIGYDENAFVRTLPYAALDPAECVRAFSINRSLTAQMLRPLPDAAFARWGVHNEKGKVALGEMIVGYIDHLEHHLKHLLHKRELLGKPVAL